MNPTRYLADFDSATAMLYALARFLNGKDFPMLGAVPFSIPPLGIVNRLPKRLRERIYVFGGRIEAIEPKQIGRVNAEQVARWAATQYPRREYPVIAIGSSNGAVIHLFSAMQVPWLPQTFLVPIRHNGLDPDEPRRAMEHFLPLGREVLRENPEWQLHHMHDANQDRLMIQTMGYFRLKFRKMPAGYKEFLLNNLTPGGTILLVECDLKWPVTTVEKRYVFQHGALGGLTPHEYASGGPVVEAMLRSQGARYTRWDPPPTDHDAPEAEWGFEPALREEIQRLARQNGWRILRLIFGEPEHLSPMIADFFRWWYAQRRLPANRLLVSSFVLMEPWWTLRTGSIPFWMVFNKQPSAQALREYLQSRRPFEEIHLALFSHGVESARLVSIREWKELIDHAQSSGEFLGVDSEAYPRDFEVFIRYHLAARRIRARYGMPGPLDLTVLHNFRNIAEHSYQMELLDVTS